MRKFLVSAAIIGLVAAFPAAYAQDREHQDQGGQPQNRQQGGERHGGPQPQGGTQQAPAMQAAPERGGPPRGEMRGRERGPEGAMRGPREERQGRPTPAMAQPSQPPPNGPDNEARDRERRFGPNNEMRSPATQPNQQPPNAPNNAMRGRERGRDNAVRGPDRRFDQGNAMRGPSRDFSNVRNYHQNFRAERRFHAAAYARPRGFYDHRWAWGETLPPLFWAERYWLLDFAAYDLPPPPYGTVWVRVNDDAVLIDQYSGMIVEVDYGVFY